MTPENKNMKKEKTTEEWEKEFEEKFGHNSVCSPTGLVEILCFIRNLISDTTKNAREELKKELNKILTLYHSKEYAKKIIKNLK